MKHFSLALILLLLLFFVGAQQVQACTSGPIYGIWFYQPPTDDVHIVYLNHQTMDVTNETFGLSYTDAATQGCVSAGVQTLYLVRYRQDIGASWTVWCYSDPLNYISIPGSVFGQATIDAAVARAKVIVYGCQRKAG